VSIVHDTGVTLSAHTASCSTLRTVLSIITDLLLLLLPLPLLLLQTFSIYPQAVNVTPIVLSKAEADAVAYNTDPGKGYVFKPPKND
jgi:hypothetical protein